MPGDLTNSHEGNEAGPWHVDSPQLGRFVLEPDEAAELGRILRGRVADPTAALDALVARAERRRVEQEFDELVNLGRLLTGDRDETS